MIDPSKTVHGGPCGKCGGTLRWAKGRHCVPCMNDYSRGYRYEQRRDPRTYYSVLLANRRRRALARMAARNSEREMV